MADLMAWPADRRITVRDLQAATDRNERWSMLTSYGVLAVAGRLRRTDLDGTSHCAKA
jgi:hypothetical protein